MKKVLFAVILTAAAVVTALAQHPVGGRGKAEVDLGGAKVSVEYGRPVLRGRDIEKMLSEQLPVGSAWRMGADNPTTLTTDASLKFGNTVVGKGTYTLEAKRQDDKTWRLILTPEGGTPLEAPLTFKKSSSSAESLTMNLNEKGSSGELVLHWGTFTLSSEFKKA